VVMAIRMDDARVTLRAETRIRIRETTTRPAFAYRRRHGCRDMDQEGSAGECGNQVAEAQCVARKQISADQRREQAAQSGRDHAVDQDG
jgi:hypothetical protein